MNVAFLIKLTKKLRCIFWGNGSRLSGEQFGDMVRYIRTMLKNVQTQMWRMACAMLCENWN